MQSNKLMLIIAIGAGVLATVLAFSYISSATSAMEAEQDEPMVGLLFASDDLEANHPIDPDVDLTIKQVGVSSSPGLVQSAVKADERESIRGKVINDPVPANMPILYAHFAAIEDIDLAPASRAMAITVTNEGTMGGILVPGDRVDVLVSYKIEATPGQKDMPDFDLQNPSAAIGAMMGHLMKDSMDPDRWEVEEVLSNVRIIAVGNRLNLSRQQHLFGIESGLEGRAGESSENVVTLEVTPDEAKRLVRARAGGGNPITLLLRPAVRAEFGVADTGERGG